MGTVGGARGGRSIAVPSLAIGADDDAVCVKENVDDAESMFSDNANLLLVRTKSGSHCAFMEWGGGSWADRVAIHWIQEVLALQKQGKVPGPPISALASA